MMQIPGSFRDMLEYPGRGYQHTSCALLRRLVDTTRLSTPVGRLRDGMIVNAVVVCFWPLLSTYWYDGGDKYFCYLFGYGFLFSLMFASKFHFFGIWSFTNCDAGVFAKTEEPALISYTNFFLTIGAWYMMTWGFCIEFFVWPVRAVVLSIFMVLAVSPTSPFNKTDNPKSVRCQRYMWNKLLWIDWKSFNWICDLLVLWFVVYVWFLMHMSFNQKDDVKGWCAMQRTLTNSWEMMNFGQKTLNYLSSAGSVVITQTSWFTKPIRCLPKFAVLGLAFFFLYYTLGNWFDDIHKNKVISFVKLVGHDLGAYKNHVMAGTSVVVVWYSWQYALTHWTNYDALDCDKSALDLSSIVYGSGRVTREIVHFFVPFEWRLMSAYAHIGMIGVTWSSIWAFNLLIDSHYNYV